MIVLLSSYSKSWSNNKKDSVLVTSPTGAVIGAITVDEIKKANVKFIELENAKKIIVLKDSIIDLQRKELFVTDSLYKDAYNKVYFDNKKLNERLKKANKKANVRGGVAIGSIALLVLSILIK